MNKRTLVIYRYCQILRGRRFTARVFNVDRVETDTRGLGFSVQDHLHFFYAEDGALLAAVHGGESWELEA